MIVGSPFARVLPGDYSYMYSDTYDDYQPDQVHTKAECVDACRLEAFRVNLQSRVAFSFYKWHDKKASDFHCHCFADDGTLVRVPSTNHVVGLACTGTEASPSPPPAPPLSPPTPPSPPAAVVVDVGTDDTALSATEGDGAYRGGLVFLAIMLPLLCCVLLPLFLVWIGVIQHSNPKIQFGYVAKESRKPSIFQGVWHRKETFIQPGLEETTLQRTESQRM